MSFEVHFNYQSHEISFSDWVTLLTLCLAPLITHVAAGVPQPIYLHHKLPLWHDHICHYNPTSIVWRYLAIIDRRCRAKSWSSADMAASNAVFWTGHKWDGSEGTIQRSQDFCVRVPRRHHINPVSMSTVVTIVTTLQGVQAVYSAIIGHDQQYAHTISISTIFYPLALLGLLRLPTALWLTNDYAYRNLEECDSHAEMSIRPSSGLRSTSALVKTTADSLGSPVAPDRFHSSRIWRSIAVKMFYLLMILSLLVLSVLMMLPDVNGNDVFTTTCLTLNLLFMVFLAITLATIFTYIVLGCCNSTIIPCIIDPWYKVYTGILFTVMLLVFILAAIETRETPCGRYTTYPKSTVSDWMVCGQSTYVVGTIEQDTNSTFIGGLQNETGVGSPWVDNSYGLALWSGKGQIAVMSFDGWCAVDSKITRSSIGLFERMNATTT